MIPLDALAATGGSVGLLVVIVYLGNLGLGAWKEWQARKAAAAIAQTSGQTAITTDALATNTMILATLEAMSGETDRSARKIKHLEQEAVEAGKEHDRLRAKIRELQRINEEQAAQIQAMMTRLAQYEPTNEE